jgi:Concanavalin A-like lectin/glucanases superfamily
MNVSGRRAARWLAARIPDRRTPTRGSGPDASNDVTRMESWKRFVICPCILTAPKLRFKCSYNLNTCRTAFYKNNSCLMKTNPKLLIISGSALAAGLAQGAIQYSGAVNSVLACPTSGQPPATGSYFDLNNDGLVDFYLGFDGYTTPNAQKPFIAGYPQYANGSTMLAQRFDYIDPLDGNPKSTCGLPVTPFGAVINQNFLSAVTNGTANANAAYFYKDGNTHTVGDWVSGVKTEGYVGLEVFDTGLSTTNYGWAHIIYDSTVSPNTVTLVDYACENENLVGIIAGATNTVGAPTIYSEPQSQTVPVGANVQLKVTALANPTAAYQWKSGVIGTGVYTNLTDGGSISGSTAATLSINGATTANMLDYIVVLTNTLGQATSSPTATLTVVAPMAQPTPQSLFGGLTAKFNVNVAGGLSASYHWRKDGSNLSDGGGITGSTTSALAVGNLQSTSAGNYDVVLTIGSLSVTSSVAQLSVLPASSESAYQAAVLAAGPIAYYPLNETGNPATGNLIAYDNAGALNGVYGSDVTNGYSGVAGPGPANGYPGFASTNHAGRFTTGDLNSLINLAPWNLNTNTVTFTAWLNPNGYQPFYAGVIYTGTTNGSQAGLAYYWNNNPGGSSNVDLSFVWGQDGHNGDIGTLWDSGVMPPNGQWSFVAAAVTSSNTTVYEFGPGGVAKGVCDTNSPNTITYYPGGFTNSSMAFNMPEYIGTDPRYSDGSRNFMGLIDEVAVFNRSLSQTELQNLYNAAAGISVPVTLQINRAGNSLQLTWGPTGQLLEAGNVNGPWTTNLLATSPYLLSPTNSQTFYRVLVH